MMLDGISISNHFAKLGKPFCVATTRSSLKQPKWVCYSDVAASQLGLSEPTNTQHKDQLLALFSGQYTGQNIQCVAHDYAGHQHGKFNHFLGDGRSSHLGEWTNSQTQQRWDICLKGSGKTPYTRIADGRASIGECLREFILSTALQQRNIPTTQSLAVITSTEEVVRGSPKPIGLLVRMAPNFIRFGSFENLFYKQDSDSLRTLADFVIGQCYPQWINHDNRYYLLLEQSIIKYAELIALWQSAGFIHGLMNTDNQSILGLTMDFDTAQFMQSYQPNLCVDSFDEKRLFAFSQQPSVGFWNSNILARALSPLIDTSLIPSAVTQYETTYQHHYLTLMRNKLGLQQMQTGDEKLINEFLSCLEKHQLNYTDSFYQLTYCDNDSGLIDKLSESHWWAAYQQRLDDDNSTPGQQLASMQRSNPQSSITPEQLDQAIEQAEMGDYQLVETLITTNWA